MVGWPVVTAVCGSKLTVLPCTIGRSASGVSAGTWLASAVPGSTSPPSTLIEPRLEITVALSMYAVT